MLPRRQRRLRAVSYVGYLRYFTTICTALRRPVFRERWIATDVTAQLRRTTSECGFALPAYCLMPDHAHVLLHANSEAADLPAFMKRFKQATAFNYRQQTRQVLWQTGYHERILRDDESSEWIARYILENPIRAGLATHLGEYPYAWSDVYDLEALFVDWEHRPRSPQSQS